MISMDEGIHIDVSDEHPENAQVFRVRMRQPTSKTTVNGPSQSEKHPDLIR
jgi:hypothetical protein